jgi:beta-lactam-binding protein with PASTA domain
MKSFTRLMLVIALVGAMLSSIVGAAGAAETDGYLAAVNGASTDPVAVDAGGISIAADLAYPAASAGVLVPGGGYNVEFTGGSVGSTVAVAAEAGTAFTVVSGFANNANDTNGSAYPIDVAPIDPGMAKVTIWNATGAPVDVTVDGQGATPLDPGAGLLTMVIAAGTPLSVQIDGVSVDVPTPEDSYTDVFGVNDTLVPGVALSVVASMTQLRADLGLVSDVAVPDVVGQTEADATVAITAAGLVAGASQAPDDTVPAGSVISQDPAGGAMAPTGSTVNIVVSTGPDTSTVPVPDVTGQPEGDAQATLEGEGFVVTSTQQASPDVEIGLVISTNPSAGTEVAQGTTVEMIVSSGPGEVVVPDLLGMDTAEATAAAEAAGLTISVVEDPDNPDPDGVVVKQDPAAGTTVDGGSEVVAQLSPDLGEPWAIVHLDPNRLMTVAGVGMLPGSTVKLSVVDTDLTESVAVQDDGSWNAKFDLSDVENETEFLLVEGTAADTSDYSVTFKIPAAGQSTEVPTEETATEDNSFPIWAWLLIGVAVIALVLLIIRMVQGNKDGDTTDTTSGGTDAGDTTSGSTDAG